MNKIFQKWEKYLVPVNITKDKNGKKAVKPKPWKNGQTYTEFNLNSIALRTGQHTVNVIDVDTKDLSLIQEPLRGWLEDKLLFGGTLVVESTHGYHFYFSGTEFLLRSSTKTGANASVIDYVDFRGEGGLIFIDSNSDVASYKVLYDDEPTSEIEEIKSLLPPYNEVKVDENVTGFDNLDDNTDTEVIEPIKVGKKTLEEVIAYINNTSSNCSRDEWMRIMASAYNLIDSKANRLEPFLKQWSKDGATDEHPYSESSFNSVWKQLVNGEYGKAFKGGSLINASNKAIRNDENYEIMQKEKFERYKGLISECETIDEIKNLFTDSDWKMEPVCTKEQQKPLPKLCADRAKVILKSKGDKKTKIYVNEFKPLVLIKPKPIAIEDVDCYYTDNRFTITHGGKILEDVFKTSLSTVGMGLGYPADDFVAHVSTKAQLIQGIKKETDYTIEEEVVFTLTPSSNPSELEFLSVLTNPLHDVYEPSLRTDIVEDFFNNIWNGKAEDIIKIIALSMRFKETKLNKIHVVAPSNTGKTTFLENMGFQTIHMKRLVQALNADKGIGKHVIDGLKSSGFLLIDEANDALTQDIKNIDNYIQLDQFGQGGTQEIKLHFTCLTSTHKTAVRGMSDEMYNRLMLVELRKDEMQGTLDKSELFVNETNVYTETIIQQVKWLLKDTLTNPKYIKENLKMLQDKYRLELNDDVDEMLTEVSEYIVAEYKSLATEDGDILVRDGMYYIKRKTDIIKSIEDRFSEYSHIDKGKYSDELINHFIGDKKSSFRINRKPTQYYPLNLKKYYADANSEHSKQLMVVDEFDDLDLEEF